MTSFYDLESNFFASGVKNMSVLESIFLKIRLLFLSDSLFFICILVYDPTYDPYLSGSMGKKFLCARYYVDDKVAEEIGKLVREAEAGPKLKKTGDVCPSQDAAVIFGKMHELAAKVMKWGAPAV